jgi:hypothetical protein
MNHQKNTFGKLSLKKELTRSDLKGIKGGTSYTCCSDGEKFNIGCSPAYCPATGRGTGYCC